MEEDLLQALFGGLAAGAVQPGDPEDLGSSLEGGGIIGLIDRLVGSGLDALYHRQPNETAQTAPIGGPQGRPPEPLPPSFEEAQARAAPAQADAARVVPEEERGPTHQPISHAIFDELTGQGRGQQVMDEMGVVGSPGALEMVEPGGAMTAGSLVFGRGPDAFRFTATGLQDMLSTLKGLDTQDLAEFSRRVFSRGSEDVIAGMQGRTLQGTSAVDEVLPFEQLFPLGENERRATDLMASATEGEMLRRLRNTSGKARQELLSFFDEMGLPFPAEPDNAVLDARLREAGAEVGQAFIDLISGR